MKGMRLANRRWNVEAVHRMSPVEDDGFEAILECEDPGCGRRLAYRRPKGLEVLQHGGASAMHWFNTGIGAEAVLTR